ncbi:MAG: elongation factor P [Firmicutes bacterium]|nr:elongation factor P [Dethiobacter sp.]MBS3889280.1 elongation factor P [Bacillota bacterium]MBS4053176.1 elongation factor P [Thermaerobacter sp.]
MISTSEFRTGLTVEIDGVVYQIIDFQHVKPGKGAAFVRAKLKNVMTGGVQEMTFRAGEKVNRAHVERRTMQYLYDTGDFYTFMDTENYEQMNVNHATIGDDIKYLKPNENISLLMYQERVMGVELPFYVELTVADTAPGYRGDTATGGSKPATMETGLVINVPFFINVGDKLRIDTRTKEYLDRA